MQIDPDSVRLAYQGWEIRSRLTHVSFDGMVAAGAMLFFDEACKCHIVSSRQFSSGGDAISAIEIKATLWIDERHDNPRADRAGPALLP